MEKDISEEEFDFNISSDSLKEKYLVSAIFYKHDSCLCRKNCIIKKKGVKAEPELLVVMMNPGSCKPIGTYVENERCECKMDATQKQIAILMEYANLNCVQIENLSDICERQEERFWEKYNLNKDLKSIFSEDRISEIENLNIPIIYAWGKAAMNLSEKIGIDTILKGRNVYGYVKNNTDYYQRPLSRFMSNEDKELWIKQINIHIESKESKR